MAIVTGGPVLCPDGVLRCPWAVGAPDYLDYHDSEWGRPVRDDGGLYERLCLEAFQSGLSWLTILRKRPAFRSAFDGFDPTLVASYGEEQVLRLLANPGIVRNRAKVVAAIANAKATTELGAGGLTRLIWSHQPPVAVSPVRPVTTADVPATTPQSTALAAALRGAGFRFIGPTTAYALMQACGLVDDHLDGCVVPPAARAFSGQ